MRKILPPVLFLIFAAAMALICWAMGSPHNLAFPANLAGMVLLVSGLGISAYHSRLFRQLGTNIMTFDEPDTLVTAGMFRYSRNPMYLGFVLALLGLAVLYQAAVSSLLLVLLFWLVADRWYIRFEEAAMLAKFGDAYRAYCQVTPRWIGLVK
jgi:protein-S-isoprenylcysteine O-methyltransferase Ste14